jgi:hypothetical protein
VSTAEQQRKWRASKGARTGKPGRPAIEPCGTTAAYKRHVRERAAAIREGREPEEIDQACKDANARATKERRQRST